MSPKETSYSYGAASQEHQLAKYRGRSSNRWAVRLDLARRLFASVDMGAAPSDTVVVDVGCSIGTFAIEFAEMGYRAYGIDFDPAALEIARELAAERGVAPTFVERDVAEWGEEFPPIDLAICFDIFEHLHDDELGALLQGLRRSMSPGGSMLFHTYPTQYNYMFFGWRRAVLMPFAGLPPASFARVVRFAAAVGDGVARRTRAERIARAPHCNPLTPSRLRVILERAGFAVRTLETGQLYPKPQRKLRAFAGQPIAHMNVWGVATPRPHQLVLSGD